MDRDSYRFDIKIEVHDPGRAQLERIDRELAKKLASDLQEEWSQRMIDVLENNPRVKK